MSKAFTAKIFAFLHQVNRDPRLKKVDAAVGLELSDHFNEDQDGRAWPSCKAIADAIGVSEHTVIRSVRRLAAEGHLRVLWGCQGRGHPNQYWMVLKPAPAQVSEAGKPASATRLKPAPVVVKPAPVQENHLKNHPMGVLNRTPIGERERDARMRARDPCRWGEPGGSPAAEASAVEEASKEGSAAEARKEEKRSAQNLEVRNSDFEALRSIWVRPWADDPEADRRALEAALRDGADLGEVIEAARAWAAAVEPRFLPSLAKWLAGRGWLKPPPAKRCRTAGPSRRPTGMEVAAAFSAFEAKREAESRRRYEEFSAAYAEAERRAAS